MKTEILPSLDRAGRGSPDELFASMGRGAADAFACADELRRMGYGDRISQIHSLLGYVCGLLLDMRHLERPKDGRPLTVTSVSFSSVTQDELKEIWDEF